MNYLYSAIGALLMAFAVGNVLEPMQLVTGGVSGIAIMVKQYTERLFSHNEWFVGGYFSEGIPLWLTTIVVNIPLFIAAYKRKGSNFVGNSLWGTVCLTVFLGVLPQFKILPKDTVLCSLFGGLIEGVGIGLVLLSKGSTGGSDLFATLLHDVFPHHSIPRIMGMIDGVVVAAGFFVFGMEKGLYALITIFIISFTSDLVIGGLGRSHIAFIISDYSKQIAGAVMREMNRGITGIDVKGLYRDRNRTMLMCVTSKKQLVAIKEIVAKYDPQAFVIITNAKETLGEGFLSLGNNIR